MLGNNSHVLAAASSGGGFSSSSLILIVIVVAVFYLLIIRPQRRRQQKVARQQNSVQPGATVRTTAGMYATVVEVDGDDVVLEVAPGVHVKYMKRAIMDVVTPAEDVTEDAFASDGEPVDAEGGTGESADDTSGAAAASDEQEMAQDETAGAKQD